MYSIFKTTVSDDQPSYSGLINPGIAVIPAQHEEDIASSVLILEGTQNSEFFKKASVEDKGVAGYVARINRMMKEFNEKNEHAVDCKTDKAGQNKNFKEKSKFCKFNSSILNECAKFPFGYVEGENGLLSPCVYLKFNRVLNKVPEPIKSKADFPEDADDGMKNCIKKAKFPDKVFIDCQG